MSGYIDRIKEMMVKARLKQRKLATLMGVNETTISNYLNGTRGMKIDVILSMCSAMEPFIGDCRFYVITGQHPEDHIKAFDINENYIAKRDVIGAVEDFLLDMSNMKEIVIIGDMNDLVKAFAEKVSSIESEQIGKQANKDY